MSRIKDFIKREAVLCIAFLAAVISCLFVPPDTEYLHYIDLRTLALLQAELPLKKAAALAAEIHGVKKNALYKYALEQQG